VNKKKRNKNKKMSGGNVQVSLLQYRPGTYTRNTLGVATLTLNDHGFTNSDILYVKFTTGAAVSQLVEECDVVNANTFTINVGGATITTGNVLVAGLVFNKSGTYTIDSTAKITVDIPSHGLPDGSDLYVRYTSGSGSSGTAVIERIVNAGRFTVVKKGNPGGFYSEFGVTQFHDELNYGEGVSVYVIDEGFNDVDLTNPGVQTTTDLAEFTIVNISTPGAGGGGLSHGGLVCALLGASRKNGAGIIGICPDANLFIADVDDEDGNIFISKVVQAIDDARARNVDIINMSLGTEVNSSALAQAVQRAINDNILVFASTGNAGTTVYEYPAAYPGVISVASVNINRQPSSFNTRNDQIDLFAPGENYPLPSPQDTQDIVYVNGTSFSSPFASGLAALYINKRRRELQNPTFRPSSQEVIEVLRGEGYLATSSITYGPQEIASSGAGGAGVAIVAAAFLVVILIVLAFGKSTPTPSIPINQKVK
jgi:hypothetical protein